MTCRLAVVCAVVFFLAAAPARSAQKRDWQTGTIVDAGVARDLTVGAAAGRAPFGPPRPAGTTPAPEVATYTIETRDQRLELKDTISVGPDTLNLTVGDKVSLAVEKKSVYIRDDKGREYRYRLVKVAPKPPA